MSLFEELLDNKGGETAQRMFSVTTGKVVENWEAEHPGMVKVELFLGEEGKNKTDWVRVAQPYAGNGRGSYFLPEVGDEVVLAFYQGDRDHPIVIGSLWNKVDLIPKETAVEKNTVKRLKTRGGHELIFDEKEEKEAITLHTPGKLTLTMEDEKKLITLKDGAGKNLLIIDGENGTVTVTAEKKVVLEAGSGSLTLDGQGKKATLKMDTVNIEAGQNLSISGQNVKIKGSVMQVEASSKLDVKGGAALSLKGTMVKIN